MWENDVFEWVRVFAIRVSSKYLWHGQNQALDKYPEWRSANEENPIVSVAYVPTGNLKNRWQLLTTGRCRPPQPRFFTARFGTRLSSPSSLARTLSTQLSTFFRGCERDVWKEGAGREKERLRWRWAGYGGRQAASEKCPWSVTTHHLFFSLLLLFCPRPAPPCAQRPHRVRRREDSERMGHTCAAHSLVFFSSFLPSFLPVLLFLLRLLLPPRPVHPLRALPPTSSISQLAILCCARGDEVSNSREPLSGIVIYTCHGVVVHHVSRTLGTLLLPYRAPGIRKSRVPQLAEKVFINKSTDFNRIK